MANPQPFLGKVITITGAARGIGLATAVYLAVHGADLSLADVQQNELELIRDKIQHKYPTRTVFSYQVDVSDPEAVNNWIDRTIEVFGRIDGCVNNAGIAGELRPLTEMTDEGFAQTIAVNLTGVFNCLRSQLKWIKSGGSIVNTASILGIRGMEGAGAYCASKHGVVGLTKVAAREGADRNVRVNVICPGMVNTLLLGDFDEQMGRELTPELTPQALKRVAEPTEICGMIGHLLGAESKFTTGAVINIDGGWSS